MRSIRRVIRRVYASPLMSEEDVRLTDFPIQSETGGNECYAVIGALETWLVKHRSTPYPEFKKIVRMVEADVIRAKKRGDLSIAYDIF